MHENNIGIFDSGIGGLTVYKEIAQLLPNENIIYLGDTARVPYGTKSQETVLKYTVQNALFLMDQGVKAIVIACNTASAFGLEALQRYLKVPVLGVIEPGARAALQVSKNKKIGIIGTEGTVRSQAYHQALRNLDPSCEVSAQACPLFVPLAEEGWFEGEVVDKIIATYLEGLKQAKADTVILGCTHYPVFYKSLQKYLGVDRAIVNSAAEVALSLKKVLEENRLCRQSGKLGTTVFYSTDAPDRMKRVGRVFLGSDLGEVKKVEI